MNNTTPFFKAFGPLLFGKPETPSFSETVTKFSQCTSLLRKTFAYCIPQALLNRRSSGQNSRKRLFPLEVVFLGGLEQVQTPNGSCRQAVRKIMPYVCSKLQRKKGQVMSPDTSAYCQARVKIPLDVMDEINAHLVERLENHISTDILWHGRHVRLVDGTGISMPDTQANQLRWPQGKSQKPGCGFPLMNLVGIFSLHTGALMKTAYSDRHTHQSKLSDRLPPFQAQT